MRASPKRTSGRQPKRKDVASGSENDVRSESNESDDTVKLEDVQDAENCQYKMELEKYQASITLESEARVIHGRQMSTQHNLNSNLVPQMLEIRKETSLSNSALMGQEQIKNIHKNYKRSRLVSA